MLITVVLGIIIFYLQTCRRTPVKTEYVTTVKRDTIYNEVHDTTVWRVPVIRKEILHDTLIDIQHVPYYATDEELRVDHFTERYYEDTTRIEHGLIITRDTVRTNRIVAHQVEHRLSLPTIREVVTVTEKPRTEVYAGLGMISGKRDFIHGFEGTLSLKNKADQIYSLGGIVQTDGQVYYKGSIMFKLSLKRKNQ